MLLILLRYAPLINQIKLNVKLINLGLQSKIKTKVEEYFFGLENVYCNLYLFR